MGGAKGCRAGCKLDYFMKQFSYQTLKLGDAILR